MSTDNPNPEIERGLLVSYERDVKIEEVEGKPVVRCRSIIPARPHL